MIRKDIRFPDDGVRTHHRIVRIELGVSQGVVRIGSFFSEQAANAPSPQPDRLSYFEITGADFAAIALLRADDLVEKYGPAATLAEMIAAEATLTCSGPRPRTPRAPPDGLPRDALVGCGAGATAAGADQVGSSPRAGMGCTAHPKLMDPSAVRRRLRPPLSFNLLTE